MKKYIVCSLCFWILCSSCNDWLDVKPQGQTEEEDMYTTYEGFKDALTGCYVKLKDRDLYGEGLTMSHIESLAQLWDLSGSTRDADLALARYEYENTYAKSVISGIYGGLYNVIVQANSVLRHLEHGGGLYRGFRGFSGLAGRGVCHSGFLSFGRVAAFRADASKSGTQGDVAILGRRVVQEFTKVLRLCGFLREIGK